MSGKVRNAALYATAAALRERAAHLQAENAKDLERGREMGLSSAMLDRLELSDKRIESMAKSVEQIAAQPDPVGKVTEGRVLDAGVRLERVRVPIGVVLIIFESRPNVTSDAAALCLKSGNAVILRGGKEAAHSNAAIAECVVHGLETAGIDPAAVQLVATPDRAAVTELLADGRPDRPVHPPRRREPDPRGGRAGPHPRDQALRRQLSHLRRRRLRRGHGPRGLPQRQGPAARRVQRDRDLSVPPGRRRGRSAREGLPDLADAGVEIRGCTRTIGHFPGAKPADEADWFAEYLDKIVAVRVVDSLDDAITHVNRYGSKHTDAVLTRSVAAADRFVNEVDSANVFVNCSTRFSDGGVYGLGAEIGISTDKLHARGPWAPTT